MSYISRKFAKLLPVKIALIAFLLYSPVLFSDAYYNIGLLIPRACGPIKFVQSQDTGLVRFGPPTQALTETAGNLLVVEVFAGTGAATTAPNETITVSDTLGNTYYPGPMFDVPGTGNNSLVQLFYSPNIAGGANLISVTANLGGSPAPWVGLLVSEYSGLATTAVADVSSGRVAPSSTASVSPGTMTVQNSCDLVVDAFYDYTGGGQTLGFPGGWKTAVFDSGWAAQIDNSATGARLNIAVNPVITESAATTTWTATQMALRASNTSALAQPTQLAFTTAAQSAAIWNCSTPLTIQTQNASSQPTTTATGITVGLSASNIGFYADAKCAYPITSTLIGAGMNSQTVYFMASSVASPVITASTSGFTSINQTETISSPSPYTWTGGAGCNSIWATGACWQGGVAPNANQIAVFDGTCTVNCSPTLGTSPSIGGLFMLSGYSGTITMANKNFTVGASGFQLNAGTINMPTSLTKAFTVNGPFTMTGGNFNTLVNIGNFSVLSFTQSGGTFSSSANTSTTTTITGPFKLSGGTFNAPAGTLLALANWTVTGSPTFTAPVGSFVVFDGGGTYLTPGSISYANVTFQNSGGYDLGAGTMNIAGTFKLNNTFAGTINNGTINVTGDLDTSNGGYGGTSTVVMTGNASGQTIIGGGNLIPNLTIAAGANPLTITGIVKMSCYFTVTSVGTFSAASSTLDWERDGCDDSTSHLSPGTVTYGNVVLSGYNTVVDLTGSTWNIGGTLGIGDSDNASGINNGTIRVVGNITVQGGGNFGTANIVAISSAAGQTINGNSLSIPNLEIAAGTNTVTLNGEIRPGNFTMTSVGTFNTAGSTLKWIRNSAACDTGGASFCQIIPGTKTYGNVYLNTYDSDFDIGGGTWTVGGTLSLGSGRIQTHAINNGTIQALGNVVMLDNGFSGGTGSILIGGNAAGQTIFGNGTDLPNLQIAAGTNPVTLNGIVGSFGNYTMTSVGTFTTTGSTLDLSANFTSVTVIPGTVTYNNVSFGVTPIGVNSGNYDLGAGTMNVGGNLTIGSWAFGNVINNGTFNVANGFTDMYDGLAGTANINFVGSIAQAVSSNGLSIPAGAVTVNSTGGGSVTLSSAVAWNNPGQALTVSSGTLFMAGHTLHVGGILTINPGATVTKSGGTLTFSSLVNNGTLNP